MLREKGDLMHLRKVLKRYDASRTGIKPLFTEGGSYRAPQGDSITVMILIIPKQQILDSSK